MDRGAWQATVHGVAKSWTQLTLFTSSVFFLKAAEITWSLGGPVQGLVGDFSFAKEVCKQSQFTKVVRFLINRPGLGSLAAWKQILALEGASFHRGYGPAGPGSV